MPPDTTTRRRWSPSVARKAYAGRTDYHENPGYPYGRLVSSTGSVSEDAPYLGGIQTTVSEGHQVSQLRKAGLTDIGGPFETTREYVDIRGMRNANVSYDNQFSFGPALKARTHFKQGLIFPRMQLKAGPKGRVSPFFPPSARSSNEVLDELGATAIARCKPTNPPVDAAQAIGELYREGIPHMVGSQSWKARTDVARSASSDYLNVQFGWLPLVSEMRSLADTAIKLDTVLAQYERDSGKVVRRQYRFPIEYSSVNTTENNNPILPAMAYPGQFMEYFGSPSNVRVSEETEIHRWFSGAFTYYLPSGYDSRDKLSKLRLVADRFGLELTPDLVWELSPWSWAADWFSNAGDVISNVSDFATGGLVMHYGYMMERSIRRRTYIQENSGIRINAENVPAGPISLVTETKVRRQANPFGFGVSWEGLSTFQASILAALGISRRR